MPGIPSLLQIDGSFRASPVTVVAATPVLARTLSIDSTQDATFTFDSTQSATQTFDSTQSVTVTVDS